MEEHGHEGGHPAHRTGFHWLDISLALSAVLISLISLWLAIHNARTMEKLVASNSYPNIDFEFGNQWDFQDGQGLRHAIYLSLQNSGIGPARLRAIELSFGGKPATGLRALLSLCCTREPEESLPRVHAWFSGDERGAMIRAGKGVTLFAWAENAGDPRWSRFEAARDDIGIRVCYCSVFDECYVRDSAHREPVPVKACPEPAAPYTGD